METINPLINNAQDVIDRIQSTINEILIEIPEIFKKYSSLDHILKNNFDQNVLSIISSAVIFLMKNLEISSISSSRNAMKWIGLENFLNRAEEERKKLELVLEDSISNSFLVNEIQTILKPHQKSQHDFLAIEKNFRELREEIKKSINNRREKKENYLRIKVLEK